MMVAHARYWLSWLSSACCYAPRSARTSPGASATRIEGLTSFPSLVSPASRFSCPTRQPRNVSQFSQWRYRMKSVLGETTDPTVEEFDLGPAVITSRLISVSPLELTSRRLATVHPLRC